MELWEGRENDLNGEPEASPETSDTAAQSGFTVENDAAAEAQAELASGVSEAEATEVAEVKASELSEDLQADVSEEVVAKKEPNKFVKGLKKAGKHFWFWIKRHKVLTVFLIILIIAAVVVFNMYQKRQQVVAIQTMDITVETSTIQTMDLSNSVGVTGTISTAESFTGTTTLSNIEVSEVYVELGDTVEEGDIICTFDSSDLEEALAEAESNYAINQQLEALEDSAEDVYNETVENATEQLEELDEATDDAKAEYVDALAAMDEAKEELDEAETALTKAQKAYEKAETALKKAIVKYDNAVGGTYNFSSEQDVTDIDGYLKNIKDTNEENYRTYLSSAVTAYNEAAEAYQEAQAAVTEAEQEYSSAQTTVDQTYAAYEQAWEAEDAYEETYDETLADAYTQYQKSLLNEELTSDDDELSVIEDYKDQIEDCIVYAGMSGTITSLNVSAGEVFSGGSIYEIQDTEYFIVEATVDEYDIVDIEEGMTAYVVTDATGDEELAAEVTYVAVTGTSGSSMGSVSGTAAYEIQITITEPQTLLRSGMSASVSIALEESNGCLAVPYDCVQTNDAGESVIYVDIDGQSTEVVVETGIETDYYTEVISDEISEGMTVYLANAMLVQSGSADIDVTDDSTDSEDGGSILDSLTGGDAGGGSMPSGGGGDAGGGMGGGGMGGGF